MIRNLKPLLLFAAALLALGAVGAAGAQAAEFHCSVEPCKVTLKPDGTAKQRHQVFVINSGLESVSFTCNEVTGEGTQVTKTAKELTLFNLEYLTCSVAGIIASVKMNGCDYAVASAGTMSIKCPAGKKIEWNVLGCTATIGEQSSLSAVKFTNITGKTEITMETAVKGIKGTIDASETCSMKPGEFSAGEITTGNVILTAEIDNGEPKMASIWWE